MFHRTADNSLYNANGERAPEIQKSKLVLKLTASACLTALAACTTTGAETRGSTRPDPVVEGRTYASLKCAGCHALDLNDLGPNWDAPPMKTLLPHLEFKILERDRSGDATLTHGQMPPLHLSMLEKEGLVAYLQSLSGSPTQ
ncbi:hypothetical protein DF3PB_10098 [uncultured Defluviicoccus sp.]|uniref:Cytochrome c domain-containing protein n=1 Tax=metagenome TaxID=256318 RepID=A0A380T7I0_9ZZZZ|nr:hypothetical protein DF3PB_10098 [uncultured Defluviicoccus sp.]